MTDLFAILRFKCTIPIEMSILEGGYFLHSKNWNQEEGDAIHLWTNQYEELKFQSHFEHFFLKEIVLVPTRILIHYQRGGISGWSGGKKGGFVNLLTVNDIGWSIYLLFCIIIISCLKFIDFQIIKSEWLVNLLSEDFKISLTCHQSYMWHTAKWHISPKWKL